MAEIKFSKEEKDILITKIKCYFREELDQDIGGFDADFLLDFITKEMGVYFYNRGLSDAQAALSNKVDEISEAIYELEKPIDFPW